MTTPAPKAEGAADPGMSAVEHVSPHAEDFAHVLRRLAIEKERLRAARA